MSKFLEIFNDLVIKTLNQVYELSTRLAPKFAFSLIVLLIGWVCAILLKKIFSKLLKALGFDVLSKKTGLKNFLERGGIQKPFSSIVGLGIYWIIVFSALIMVFNALGLEVASRMIEQVIFYIPKIVVSLILITLGIFLSKFIGRLVETSARLANIPFHFALDRLARYIIIGLSIIIALEYLGAATAIVMHYVIIIFIILPLMATLIFLVGGRDILSSMLAGRLIIKGYEKGDTIEFDSISGQIESIDFITTKIKSKEGQIIVPNSELVRKIIKKVKANSGQN
ncbi:MAG: mechanosensitive ion channel domain-containing protein [Candidatus Omnitrophota bacterium]